jgi:hypothetical protein
MSEFLIVFDSSSSTQFLGQSGPRTDPEQTAVPWTILPVKRLRQSSVTPSGDSRAGMEGHNTHWKAVARSSVVAWIHDNAERPRRLSETSVSHDQRDDDMSRSILAILARHGGCQAKVLTIIRRLCRSSRWLPAITADSENPFATRPMPCEERVESIDALSVTHTSALQEAFDAQTIAQ